MSNVGYTTLAIIPAAADFGRALAPSSAAPNRSGVSSGVALGDVLSRSLSRSLAPIAIAFAAIEVGRFVGAAVRSAGALEQSIGAVETVFGASSGQMHEWARGAATSVGLARDEYNGLATRLGSQPKNAGVAATDLGASTDAAIRFGADLAAQFGGPTVDAVEASSSALKGEMDPIEKYGITLNEAAMTAHAATMGFTGTLT